jgi:curved DNA-binding protein CbpA
MATHYSALGVDPKALLDDIKKAYRRISLTNHPDKTIGLSEDERREGQTQSTPRL